MNSVFPILAAAPRRRSSAVIRRRARLMAAVVSLGVLAAIAPSARGAPVVRWIQQFGTSDFDLVTGLAADGLQNVYLAGGVDRFGAPGFLSKLDVTGQTVWSQQKGYVTSIAADGFGNLFAAIDTPADGELEKLDSNGQSQWIRQLGMGGIVYLDGVSADGLGGAYVAGFNFNDPLHAFLRSYDGQGNVQWTRQLEHEHGRHNIDVSSNDQGDVFIAGQQNLRFGFPEPFLARSDAQGNLAWTTHLPVIADNHQNHNSDVAADALGNVYLAGQTTVYADAVINHEYRGYLAKFDREGNRQWTREFNNGSALAVAVDAYGFIYAGGYLETSQAFQGDAFVAKFAPDGTQLWTHDIGAGVAGSHGVAALAVDDHGNIFAAGTTSGQLGATHFGGVDVWVALLREAPAPKAGDFDNDGNVDGRDFLALQRNPSIGSLADWQANYGAASLASGVNVPEPGTSTLLFAIAMFFVGRNKPCAAINKNKRHEFRQRILPKLRTACSGLPSRHYFARRF